MTENIRLPFGRGNNRFERLTAFAEYLLAIQSQIAPMKLSSRGWGYELESRRLINKDKINRVQKLINDCRKNGLLPIDFVLEDRSRLFEGVWYPTQEEPQMYLKQILEWVMDAGDNYNPDYWDGEKYYVQMLVEKIDLVSLFKPICDEYHIPIATSKGWFILQTLNDLAQRFKIMEKTGHSPILLYCGDHDPYGLAISDYLMENLIKVRTGTGWNPHTLVIDRFGLNYDFIMEHNLVWIDNLISGSGKKPDKKNPIVKRYVEKFGERKVEANAVIRVKEKARFLCRQTIEKYMDGALERFSEKKQVILDRFDDLQRATGIMIPLKEAYDIISQEEETEE